jgi:hypothetical protein
MVGYPETLRNVERESCNTVFFGEPKLEVPSDPDALLTGPGCGGSGKHPTAKALSVGLSKAYFKSLGLPSLIEE